MKNYFFKINLSLLLLIVTSFSFAQNTDSIQFEKKVQKFKKVNEGEIIELTYPFTYQGNTPLNIIPPEVDCSCTTVILPEGKIKADNTYHIKITFDTKGKIGYQERSVNLSFVSDLDHSNYAQKKVTFKGVVKASDETKKAYKLRKKKH